MIRLRKSSGQTSFVGSLFAGGTPGQVLTVQTDGSVSPAPGGGSLPTDEVFVFEGGATQDGPEPITALNVSTPGANTITFAGDYADVFNNALVKSNVGITISGSSDNDSTYTIVSAAFAAGHTTVTVSDDLTSGTVDGEVSIPVAFEASVELPANSAVEWVLLVTEAAWPETFYTSGGDADDDQAFAIGSDRKAEGVWQWPLNTTHQASAYNGNSPSDFNTLGGNELGYKLYPAGTTVTFRAAQDVASVGTTRIVVHHHFTEPVAATRVPAL